MYRQSGMNPKFNTQARGSVLHTTLICRSQLDEKEVLLQGGYIVYVFANLCLQINRTVSQINCMSSSQCLENIFELISKGTAGDIQSDSSMK